STHTFTSDTTEQPIPKTVWTRRPGRLELTRKMDTVYRFIYQLGRSINHAVAISLKQDPEKTERTQYVAAITLVKGIPFYGFHSKYEYFFKIYLLDPGLQSRVVELLSKGIVMGKQFLTYESHIPYLPQFLIDHNLLGMDYMDVADARFRRPLQEIHDPENTQPTFLTPQNIPSSKTWPATSPLTRESFCSLELDLLAIDILNRTRIPERATKPLIDLLNGTTRLDTKLVPSLKSLWTDEDQRRVKRGLPPIEPVPLSDAQNQPVVQTQQSLVNELMAVIERHRVVKEADPMEARYGSGGGAHYDFPGVPDDGVPTVFHAISALYFGGAQKEPRGVAENNDAYEGVDVLSQLSGAFTRFREEEELLSQARGGQKDAFDGVMVDENALTQNVIIKDAEVYAQEHGEGEMEEVEDLDGAHGRDQHADNEDEDDFWKEIGVNEEDVPGDADAAYWDALGDPELEPGDLEDVNVQNVEAAPVGQWKGKERLLPPVIGADVQDIESLAQSNSATLGFEFDEDMDPDLIQQQIEALEAYERQQQQHLQEVREIRSKYNTDEIHSMIAEAESQLNSAPKGGPSGLARPDIDQNDGPPGSPPRGKRSRAAHEKGEDIDDSEGEFDAPPKKKKTSGVIRKSLDISTPSTPAAPKSDVKKKMVTFNILDHRDDRFRPAPKFKVASPSLSNSRTSSSSSASAPRTAQPSVSFASMVSSPVEPQDTFALNARRASAVGAGEASSTPAAPGKHMLTSAKSLITPLPRERPTTPSAQPLPRRSASKIIIPSRSTLSNSISASTPKNSILTNNRSRTRIPNANPSNTPTFISKLGGMWSPEKPAAETNTSFFSSPPRPSSPSNEVSSSRSSFVSDSLGSNPFLPNAQKSVDDHAPQQPFEPSNGWPDDNINSIPFSPDPMPNEQHNPSSQSNIPRLPNVFRLKHRPPTLKSLYENWPPNLPEREYKDPFFSNPRDATKTRTFSNRRIKVSSETDVNSVPHFNEISNESIRMFPGVGGVDARVVGMESLKAANGLKDTKAKPFVTGMLHESTRVWKLAKGPPSMDMARSWLKENPSTSRGDGTFKPDLKKASQLEGPTQKNKYGYKYSQIQTEALDHELEHLIAMSCEILTHSMTESVRVLEKHPKMKLPDPAKDSIQAAFYCFQGHNPRVHKTNGHRAGYHVGMIIVEGRDEEDDGSGPMPFKLNGIAGYVVTKVESELQLFEALLGKVREFDPDILLGYEVHLSSWGYLIERAKLRFNYDFLKDLSRMEKNAKTKFGREQDPFSYKDTSAISTTGRIFLNVWRLMRSELTLTSYTLENCVFHVLHERIPKFSASTLYSWYSAKGLKRWRALVYYLERVQYTLDLLDDTSFLSRSCEFARVYGIDLFSVIARGSQYRVESMLARITRPENFVQLSPTREQVRNMRAIECIALVKEPQTRFFKNPMAVLDFQSLYPSVMIGYNICYSTCLGRLRDLGATKESDNESKQPKAKFGALKILEIPMEVVDALKEHLHITHNGVIFVKSHIREGALGRMLREILETRIMVKSAMKSYKDQKASFSVAFVAKALTKCCYELEQALLRILEARQLGLKLVANVTYGYAGASFTGRMPCVEIADSIVETGRRSLEAAMKYVTDNQDELGGTVVYGDTDSLFVELPGKSLKSAFGIGIDIANRVSLLNPAPMKLKFEKIYLPCILLAKKRYVGFMYENVDDTVPVFDAKGIETVRRDGFPAMAKIVEDALKILFRSQDMSQLKEYLYRQWDKILTNRVSLSDLVVATEFKLKEYRNMPPGVALCMRSMNYDKRTEPQAGERIPYIICRARNTRFSGRSYFPLDVVKDRTLKPDGNAYVRKSVQALSRIFRLVGIDVETWFNMMPKKQVAVRFSAPGKHPKAAPARGQYKIDQFYQSNHCLICNGLTANDLLRLCESCKTNHTQNTIANLYGRLSEIERKRNSLQSICRSCSMQPAGMNLPDAKCISIECPVMFVRVQAGQEYSAMRPVLMEALDEVKDA
ncbi:DNA polymerase zeta, partial [Podochytrium sp. JEL0797]